MKRGSFDSAINNQASRLLYPRQLKPIRYEDMIQEDQPLEIFFDEDKKKDYINSIIDSYFDLSPVIVNTRKNIMNEHTNKFLIKKRIGSHTTKNKRETKSFHLTYPKGFIQNESFQEKQMQKTFLSDHALPPIQESEHDTEIKAPIQMALSEIIQQDIQQQSQSKVTTMQSFLNHNKSRRSKLVEDTELFRVYYTYEDKKISSMVKEYKQPGKEIFMREQKLFGMLRTTNIEPMWMATAMMTCHSKYFPTFKQTLYEITNESIKAENISKIIIKPFYDTLFLNQNQILLEYIRQVCEQLATLNGKIINNKIGLGNLYMQADNKVVVGEWGHSATLETATVANQTVSEKMNPILKGKTQWFVTPEYLPPELLEYVIGMREYNMWENSTAIDMWSLGCTILQILTLVPLWIPHRCILNHKRTVFRRGIFHSKTRQLPSIITKQKKFCSNLILHLEKMEEIQSRVNFKIIELLKGMLELDYQRRLRPEEALKIIG